MARVTVVPEEFSLVAYDAHRIRELVDQVAVAIGLPADTEIDVHVDERTPLGASSLSSLRPVRINVQSGAFEDAKHPRHLSERNVVSLVGRLLLRAKDRLGPGFAAAPADQELTPAQDVAWDAYAVGRCARLGFAVQKPRRRYHFRIRHGFTDAADMAFERLWEADDLTWADIQAVCADAGAQP